MFFNREALYKSITFIVVGIMSMMYTSCFTGVESTKKISEKDVVKVVGETFRQHVSDIDSLSTPNLLNWRRGKQFYVTDENFKLLLMPSALKFDSIDLKGSILTYEDYEEENFRGIDNTVIANLVTPDGTLLKYDTRKTKKELEESVYSNKVPFLIDRDIIDVASKRLVGETYFLNSPLWVDSLGNAVTGTKYDSVKIVDVLPGNKVYTLKIQFSTPDSCKYYIYVSVLEDMVQSRLFGNIFSKEDPHTFYPLISETNWERIKKGELEVGMTKDECRLSVGAPARINKVHTYNGIQENWYYDSGMVIIFFDGLLERFRR